MKGLISSGFRRAGTVLLTALLLVAAALVSVPQTAEAAIFGGRSVSKSVVVQKNVAPRQQVIVQKVVAQPVRVQRVVVQQQAVYAQPVVQQVRVQAVYAQPVVQQVVTPCNTGGPGTLQLNSGGCAVLYAR